MKLKTTVLALSLAAVAAAAVPRFGSVAHRTAPIDDRLQERRLNDASPLTKSGNFTDAATARRAKSGLLKSTGYTQSQLSEIHKMGTLELVIEEDFSLMDSLGSFEQPDMKTVLQMEWGDGKEYGYPYTNFNKNYTHQPEWGAGNCFPAGGCVYFNCKNEGDQAKVNTPRLDVSANGGLCVVEFKARAKGGVYPGLLLETAETNNMGPTWRMYDDPIMYEVPEEWTTFYGVFSDAGPTTIFQLVGVAQSEVYVDDIKVYRLVPYVGLPQLKRHSDYSRDGFTANWKTVEGADGYLFSAWSYADDGTEVTMYEDEPVQTNSFRVANPVGDEYYYQVKAVKGEHVSYPSKIQNVYDIVAPELYAPEITGAQSYVGSWEDLMLAAGYSYWAYSERTAAQDGQFVVTDENFDDVARPDGTKTDFTIENPDDKAITEWYPTDIRQRGWVGKHYAPYKGFICVDGWYYGVGDSDAGFISPELDFSKDGGKFSLSVRLAGKSGYNNAYFDDPSQPEYLITQACVALFNWDEELGDYRQVELVYPQTAVTEQWQQFTFKLTKGAQRSIVGIFAVGGYDNLYIDDLKITQNYRAGESLLDPFYMHPWTYTEVADDPTSQAVSVPDRNTGGKVYHKVRAARAKTTVNPWTGGREIEKLAEGAFSPLTEVMTTEYNSLANLPTLGAEAVCSGGVLSVQNPACASVAVYAADGRKLTDLGRAAAVSTRLAPGLYVVRVGKQTFKLANN